MLLSLPKLGTIHPMVESLPPPIGCSKINTHISALFTPLVVHWQEQFLIGVILLSLWPQQAKKQQKRQDDDDNQQILSIRVLDKDPVPLIADRGHVCSPNTLFNQDEPGYDVTTSHGVPAMWNLLEIPSESFPGSPEG